MDILAVALFIALVATFAARAWRAQGWLSAADRWALLAAFAVATAACVVAPLLINWVRVPALIWLLAVGLLSGGVLGAALRWLELPWRAGAYPLRRALRIGATLTSCALIIALALV